MSHWLKVVGLGIEVFGALVIVLGLGWSTWLLLKRQMAERHYETYKIRIGRSLLLGLEVVVAADIVKTIAVEPTLMSLAVLAGLVLIRTFLSWTLVLEIEGCWPWKRIPSGTAATGVEGATRHILARANAAGPPAQVSPPVG